MGLIAWMKDVYRRASASDGGMPASDRADGPGPRVDLAAVANSIERSGCGCYRHGARDAYERYASGVSDERKLEVYRAISGKLFSYCNSTGSSNTYSNSEVVLDALRAATRMARAGNIEAILDLEEMLPSWIGSGGVRPMQVHRNGSGMDLVEAKKTFDAIGELARAGKYEAAFHLRSPARYLLERFARAYQKEKSITEHYIERYQRELKKMNDTPEHLRSRWDQEMIDKVSALHVDARDTLDWLAAHTTQANGMLWAIENGPTYRAEAFQEIIRANLPFRDKMPRLRPLANSDAVRKRIESLSRAPDIASQDVLIADFKAFYDYQRDELKTLEKHCSSVGNDISANERSWALEQSELDAMIAATTSIRGVETPGLLSSLRVARDDAELLYANRRDDLQDALNAGLTWQKDALDTLAQEGPTNQQIIDRTLPKAEYQRLRELSRRARTRRHAGIADSRTRSRGVDSPLPGGN